MNKKWLKKKIVRHRLDSHPQLSKFGGIFKQQELWHINRRSIPIGAAIGLFCAFLPIPFQMVLAAAIAVIVRGNIPVAVILVWISNPLTWGPIYYACYKIGQTVLNMPPVPFSSQSNAEWFASNFVNVMGPMTLGGVIVGGIAAAAGYAVVTLVWHWNIVAYKRHKRRRDR